MKIITRGEAMRIHRQHPASRLIPFYTGKYRWHGSTDTYTGREVQDIPGVLAVFAERRKDSFGPYVRLMSGTLYCCSGIWMPALNTCRVYPLSTGNQEQHEIINHGNRTGYSDCVAAGQY